MVAARWADNSTYKDLRDYKIYCFNGVPTYCQVISNRSTNETIDFFDMKWIHQEFTGLAQPDNPYHNSGIVIPIPGQFVEMKAAAAQLSENIPFLRVDFYEVNGKMYFGELTFYPFSGFGEFTPAIWNNRIGRILTLPRKDQKADGKDEEKNKE